jgi:hypothetical protein
MMIIHEERSVDELSEEAAPVQSGRPGAVRKTNRFAGNARTAPRGPDSRIGDDETHRRLQAARNKASHSIEHIVRKELGPEWALD